MPFSQVLTVFPVATTEESWGFAEDDVTVEIATNDRNNNAGSRFLLVQAKRASGNISDARHSVPAGTLVNIEGRNYALRAPLAFIKSGTTADRLIFRRAVADLGFRTSFTQVTHVPVILEYLYAPPAAIADGYATDLSGFQDDMDAMNAYEGESIIYGTIDIGSGAPQYRWLDNNPATNFQAPGRVGAEFLDNIHSRNIRKYTSGGSVHNQDRVVVRAWHLSGDITADWFGTVGGYSVIPTDFKALMVLDTPVDTDLAKGEAVTRVEASEQPFHLWAENQGEDTQEIVVQDGNSANVERAQNAVFHIKRPHREFVGGEIVRLPDGRQFGIDGIDIEIGDRVTRLTCRRQVAI